MPEPYDWGRERSSWGRGGGSSFVTHYELEAIVEPIEDKLNYLRERTDEIEDRLIEERAKHFAADVLSSAWTRFIVIVLAVLTAFVLTNLINVPNPFQ